jgi:hypothetical protein
VHQCNSKGIFGCVVRISVAKDIVGLDSKSAGNIRRSDGAAAMTPFIQRKSCSKLHVDAAHIYIYAAGAALRLDDAAAVALIVVVLQFQSRC